MAVCIQYNPSTLAVSYSDGDSKIITSNCCPWGTPGCDWVDQCCNASFKSYQLQLSFSGIRNCSDDALNPTYNTTWCPTHSLIPASCLWYDRVIDPFSSVDLSGSTTVTLKDDNLSEIYFSSVGTGACEKGKHNSSIVQGDCGGAIGAYTIAGYGGTVKITDRCGNL